MARKSSPPVKPRAASIGIRTAPKVKQAAAAAARAEHRSLSQWVELVIITALEKEARR